MSVVLSPLVACLDTISLSAALCEAISLSLSLSLGSESVRDDDLTTLFFLSPYVTHVFHPRKLRRGYSSLAPSLSSPPEKHETAPMTSTQNYPLGG